MAACPPTPLLLRPVAQAESIKKPRRNADCAIAQTLLPPSLRPMGWVDRLDAMPTDSDCKCMCAQTLLAHLRVEAKVDHVAEEVQVPLRLHEAAHVRHGRQQLVSLRQHARDDRVEGPFPARTVLARVL